MTILERTPEQQKDTKLWAKKIIARHESGERLSCIVLALAREALGIIEPPKREPGEEG
jgi:hypothetical protein